MKMRSRLGVELRPVHIEGAQKLERAHAVGTILPAAGRKHLQLIVGFGETLAPESDADLVRSGRGLELDVLQAGIDAIERAVLHLIVELHVFFAADDGLIDDLVVDRHHQRILVLHAVAPDVVGHVGDVDAVFAVGGEIHFRENAAARPQRQSGNVRELIAGSRAERPALRASIAPAERRERDVMGGKDVLLNEGRRNLQGGRDVVEALRGVVRRQQFGAVDVDQKQIVDRVFVLLAIQPMQHWLSVTCAWLGSLSSESSSHATSESTALPSGCFAPGGGMTRPRSLRTAFSKSSGSLAMLAAVMPSKLTPPVLALSLWQPEQYCLTVASCASAGSCACALGARR